MIQEYVRAYRDCSRYLERYMPPWAWLVGTLRACQQLHRDVTMAHVDLVPCAVALPRWEREGGSDA